MKCRPLSLLVDLLVHKIQMAAVKGVEILRSKFRGCLLGALFGDALGARFECTYFNEPVPSHEFEQFSKENLSKYQGKESVNKLFHFTDDSAMTMALCRSLLAKKTFNIKDLAKQFTDTFFREPRRGYGTGVVTVFEKLKAENLDDVTLPAREQFNGTGSYGNGAAMRVSPLALFYHNDLNELMKTAEQHSLITHANVLGIQGAVLQAVAVFESLHTPAGTLDVAKYIDKMIVTATELQNNEEIAKQKERGEACSDEEKREKYEEIDVETRQSYVSQFQHIKKMLVESEGKPNTQYVIETLGHSLKAVEAVPAAIFAFLFKSDTCLKDVLFYAMSLGGDTDTIASMAGAIAGAYWGDEQIPKEWYPVTEGIDEITKYAEQIYDLRVEAERM